MSVAHCSRFPHLARARVVSRKVHREPAAVYEQLRVNVVKTSLWILLTNHSEPCVYAEVSRQDRDEDCLRDAVGSDGPVGVVPFRENVLRLNKGVSSYRVVGVSDDRADKVVDCLGLCTLVSGRNVSGNVAGLGENERVVLGFLYGPYYLVDSYSCAGESTWQYNVTCLCCLACYRVYPSQVPLRVRQQLPLLPFLQSDLRPGRAP